MRLITALRNGALDIAIVTNELPLPGNQVMPLWSERILLALLGEHPLAGKEVVYWTDLRGETLLLSQYDPGRELEDLLMSKLVSPEDRPKIARYDVSRGIIKSLVAAGFGMSLVTESDIGANFSRSDLSRTPQRNWAVCRQQVTFGFCGDWIARQPGAGKFY